MTILSDDLVEKAARAACQACGYEPDLHIENGVKRWQAYAIPARAALEAALPGIVEECAKVGDVWLQTFGDIEITSIPARVYASDAVKDIADSIRNLSTSTIPPEHERVLYEKRFELLADEDGKEEGNG